MRTVRHCLRLTVLAVALAAGTGACGSSGGSAGPAGQGTSADPLAGLNSRQIAQRAVAGTEAAPSVRVTGSGTDSGQPITIDLTLIRGKGCQGTLSTSSMGSVKVVYNGTTVWLLPDAKFYRSQNVPASALSVLNGKYLQVKANGSSLGSLGQLCTLSKLLSQFTPHAGTAKGIATTVDGQRAVKITDKTSSGYAYVSDEADPVLLRIQKPGAGGGLVKFSYTGNRLAITPPPASQVIDGSKYGF